MVPSTTAATLIITRFMTDYSWLLALCDERGKAMMSVRWGTGLQGVGAECPADSERFCNGKK